MNMKTWTALACALALAPIAPALEVPYDLHVRCTPENAIFGHFSATKKPVATVKSGTTVRIDGGGGNKWRNEVDPNIWLKEHNIPLTVETSEALTEIMRAVKESPNKIPPAPGSPAGFSGGGHFLIGPIYVEDANPAHSIKVRILAVP